MHRHMHTVGSILETRLTFSKITVAQSLRTMPPVSPEFAYVNKK